MIDPTLAASAISTGLSLLSSAVPSDTPAAADKKDTVNRAEFLQLLITQLQNQDPLDPLDSADFSAQLAQFSSLEQLTQINDKITNLGGTGTDGSQTFDVLGLLGTDAVGAGDALTLRDGVASDVQYTVASAGSVEAVVLDSAGFEVARVDLGTQSGGTHTLDLGATTLADGSYTVRLRRLGDNDTATTLPTTISGAVTGVDLSTDPPTLLLGERRLALTDLQIIRADNGTP